ncbi:nuclear transport factor 2 family protein [Streptomyces litchfieldiae]|uniref:Nuclear transport factor 2 family protein n=1 Tax=Streptomyces litchfieldiae TaxID=3075543 RepID=A0ABU2MK39_9ACTN|nr:nuclear transport factor 2 family protein [Streptomyces sp. DSM 44938]MDT0341977.1 nuclear transport factor 2 family protein [Streptomyces sp. DSM 44938]
MGDDQELADFGRRWARAELKGDTEALAALLTSDFSAVGPRGFVLDKEKWLERYTSGALVHDSFDWENVEIRRYGDAAVALGVQSQQSIYEGRDVDGHFRISQFLTAADGQWRLAGLHLSAIAVRPPA